MFREDYDRLLEIASDEFKNLYSFSVLILKKDIIEGMLRCVMTIQL